MSIVAALIDPAAVCTALLGERLANKWIATLPLRMGIYEMVSKEKGASMSDLERESATC